MHCRNATCNPIFAITIFNRTMLRELLLFIRQRLTHLLMRFLPLLYYISFSFCHPFSMLTFRLNNHKLCLIHTDQYALTANTPGNFFSFIMLFGFTSCAKHVQEMYDAILLLIFVVEIKFPRAEMFRCIFFKLFDILFRQMTDFSP